MKCSVCGKENISMLCSECGFDSSRDYGSYPTFGPVGNVPSVSGRKREWVRKEGHAGILRADEVSVDIGCVRALVFGSEYKRKEIKSVTFVGTLAGIPGDAWDVSEEGNCSVMAWVRPNGELYDLYICGEGGVRTGASCKAMFAGYSKMERITVSSVLDTSGAQNMSGMFAGCESLTELNLVNFNTANVEDMSEMFSGCESLVWLDWINFDTASVKDMSDMFCGCKSLTELDLSTFDTSKVQNMSKMFDGCESLTELNLSAFDTSNVLDMRRMFSWCESLKWLNLSGFDTSKVQDMSEMFWGCESLTCIELHKTFVPAFARTCSMFTLCPAGDDWQHLLI